MQISTVVQGYSSDDDDEFYNDGFRKMTDEEIERYNKQVDDSQGFEVEDFSHIAWAGLIVPLPDFRKLPRLVEKVNCCSEMGIEKYNADNNANYRFLEVIKVNCSAVSGAVYFITFLAKDAADGGQSVETFEAKAYVPISGSF